MIKVRRLLVWLGRMCHSRGFGVQSPWAYRMVRYVINEHYPYYAYADLAAAHPTVDGLTRKLCELCLRLANHIRPQVVAAYGMDCTVMGEYIKAGCRRAEYREVSGDDVDLARIGADMTIIAPCDRFGEAFESLCLQPRDGSVVVLMGIRRNKAMRRLWRETLATVPSVVTFDLYYCGLVFFDRKRFKQNYIINF